MIGEFFEIDFVEFIVLVKYFSDVGLADLLQIVVHHFTIEVSHKRGQNTDGSFELFFVLALECLTVLLL